MKKFFSSDLHFDSTWTMQASRRPFKNVEEMNSTIISNWNKLVGQDDIVYVLGDFGEFDYVKKLNGKIVLVCGNYEIDYENEYFGGNFEKFKSFLQEKGFFDVYENELVINIDETNEKIHLTHKPMDCNPDMFNLFGHIHEKCKVKEFGLNVGTDEFGFVPATMDDVLFYKNAIAKFYDLDVFCNLQDLKNKSKENK